jgi:hypothetical protein
MTGPAPRFDGPGKALILVAALGALAVCGCAGPEERAGTSGAAAAAAGSAAASSPTATGAGPGTLNPTDLAWIQLQLAMDAQALHILELAPGSGAAPPR